MFGVDMITLYLGALAFGGTLLAASLALGGDKDVDKDLDKDVGVDWLPVLSLRFWTFFLAFGGATGAALTWIAELAPGVVAGAAFGVGWFSGVGTVWAMRSLRKSSASSDVSARDLRGEIAEVLVDVSKEQIGKVRVAAKGRIADLIAETDDAATYAAGEKVMILGEGAEGRVQVTRES